MREEFSDRAAREAELERLRMENKAEKLRLQKEADEMNREMIMGWVRKGLGVCLGVVLGIMILSFIHGLISPQVNLYRANTEKQSVIAEQQAISEAAVYEAEKAVTVATAKQEARIIDAEGVAQANALIAESLTGEAGEAYLRYEFIQQFSGDDDKVIYVPTDGLVPITEAGRAVEDEQPAG